jgi:hypothetical protein
MKINITSLVCVVLVSFFLSSCDFNEDVKEKTFNQNLESFNNNYNKVDSALLLIDQMQVEIDRIEESRKRGDLESSAADEKTDQIRNRYGRKIARASNLNPTTKLPLWATRLGLTEPKGMSIDIDYSQSTSESNPDDGYNSVLLVYRGEYNQAMNQARMIASMANIPMSKDFKDAQVLASEYGIESLKGMAYMNFELGAAELPPYTLSITVDEDGTLTISATDTQKLAAQLETE